MVAYIKLQPRTKEGERLTIEGDEIKLTDIRLEMGQVVGLRKGRCHAQERCWPTRFRNDSNASTKINLTESSSILVVEN